MDIAALLLLLVISFIINCMGDVPPNINLITKKEQHKLIKLPPCKSCNILVESFKKGVDRTARGKHEGGDAAWEEANLRSYKTSEIRLVEIQESLCNDVERGEEQCHSLAEEQEQMIEEWWFKHQHEEPDLFVYLCINKLEVCCPDNHFGPKCELCNNCFNNGKCKGNGTRKGNGKCACEAGYSGEICDKCETEYYESYRDTDKLLCSPCHVSCDKGGCTSSGPQGCRVCKKGWEMNAYSGGCDDIDECHEYRPCTEDQICINNEGSYICIDCDKSCKGCTGDGPDLCKECADGYELRNGLCTETNYDDYEEVDSRKSSQNFINDEL